MRYRKRWGRMSVAVAALLAGGCSEFERYERALQAVANLEERVQALEGNEAGDRLKVAEDRLANIERVTEGVGYFEIKHSLSPKLKGRVWILSAEVEPGHGKKYWMDDLLEAIPTTVVLKVACKDPPCPPSFHATVKRADSKVIWDGRVSCDHMDIRFDVPVHAARIKRVRLSP